MALMTRGVGGLNCSIVVLKRGQWPADDRTYKKNDDLSAL